MEDNRTFAERIYPGTEKVAEDSPLSGEGAAPVESPKKVNQPDKDLPEKTTAEVIYGKQPTDKEKETTDEDAPKDTADLLYGEGSISAQGPYGVSLKDSTERIATHFGLDTKEAEVSRKDAAKIFYDLNVEPKIGRHLHGLHAKYLTELPDQATIDSWGQESLRKLQERYGDKATERLDLAKQYVKQKGLSDAFDGSGLGSHPDFVMELAERVWNLHQAGKFKSDEKPKKK